MSISKRLAFQSQTRSTPARGMLQVEIKGFEELNRKLTKLAGNEGKKAVRRASKHAIKQLVPKIQAAAPTLTGDLEASFKVRSIRRSRKAVGSTIVHELPGTEFYHAFVELGTKERFHKNGKSVGAIQPGYAYIRDTANIYRGAIQRIFEIQLGIELDRIARGG